MPFRQQWMMYIPCYVIQDLTIPFELKPQHTPLTLITLFPLIVIQVRFHLRHSLGSDRTYCICKSLGQNAGQRFLLDLRVLSLIHIALNPNSLDMLVGKGTTKSRKLFSIRFLSLETLSLRKVSLTGHQQVWGRTYQFSRQMLHK